MPSQGEVQPLRIQKSLSSPQMASPKKVASPSPLSEISPMGIRRNSPSFTQLTAKQKSISRESSPFEASPAAASPLSFWRGRESASPVRSMINENAPLNRSPAQPRRSSLERLKSASRVSNSSMFARESLYRSDSTTRSYAAPPNTSPASRGHRRSQSKNNIPIYSPEKETFSRAASPPKSSTSPAKSSLSSNSRYSQYFDPDQGTWSDDDDNGANTPRASLRQPKTVSFDKAPPQINEYEQVTPDPSSVASGSREGSYDSDPFEMDDGLSYDLSGHHEDSFDESLEDTGRTPVVLPEDWSFMSPKLARTDLADTFDDPFDNTQAKSPLRRSDSVMSNGEPRPLPAIPQNEDETKPVSGRSRSDSSLLTPRSLPTPPRPASVSKAEILGMREESPMPFDERLRLLALQNQKVSQAQKDDDEAQVDDDEDFDAEPPQISRESILRQMRDLKEQEELDEQSEDLHETAEMPTPSTYADLDPDVPIPSRETSSQYGEALETPIKKEYDEELKFKFEDVPDYEGHAYGSPEAEDGCFGDESVIHHQLPDDFDDEPSMAEPSVLHDDAVVENQHRMSLPGFQDFDKKEDFQFSLQEWLSPSPPNDESQMEDTVAAEKASMVLSNTDRGLTPPESPAHGAATTREEDVQTPESVIHRPIDSDSVEDIGLQAEESDRDISEVPEVEATIRAPGSKLKTRPSITPQDLEELQAHDDDGESEADSTGKTQPISALDRRRSLKMKLDLSLPGVDEELGGLSKEFERLMDAKKRGYHMKESDNVVVASTRNVSSDHTVSTLADTVPPVIGPMTAKATGLGTRKTSGKTWTTEPWNGKMRRQSTRRSNVHSNLVNTGAVPPLPGQEAVSKALQDQVSSILNEPEDSVERGRLFVKVLGVKDLNLPLPRNERSWFQLTLDNGLHCVTTAWLELGKTAPINQEFELTVFDELDFSLTLQTKLERPQSAASSTGSISPSKTLKSSKGSALSRFLQSPKKRRENEKKQQQEEALAAQVRQRELEAQRANKVPTAWDLLHNLVGADGSFARAFVSLEDHEEQAFGHVHVVDVPCFNSWATEDIATTRSKHGGIQRRPPYKIGHLTLQLLYLPKPRGAADSDMPQSMSSAIKQLREAEVNAARQHEGFLSQQGGDCPYWRRRFFRLNGSNLTSYHETTRQRRANINLAKATKLIDDKSSLTQNGANGKAGKTRRKSAFAEDEEGYMFVEEGFRIRFANGELIDFYADNRAQKDEWMRVLSEVVGKDLSSQKFSWVNAVLAKQALTKTTSSKDTASSFNKTHSRNESAPSSPLKGNPVQRPQSTLYEKPPPPPEKSPRHDSVSDTSTERTSPSKASGSAASSHARHQKEGSWTGKRKAVKSMIF